MTHGYSASRAVILEGSGFNKTFKLRVDYRAELSAHCARLLIVNLRTQLREAAAYSKRQFDQAITEAEKSL